MKPPYRWLLVACLGLLLLPLAERWFWWNTQLAIKVGQWLQ